MKIDLDNIKKKTFKEINFGECFLWQGILHMKCIRGIVVGAVSLRSGVVYRLEDNEMVEPINCKIVNNNE